MMTVFRADASLDIGTGHVMRCLTLASAIRDSGGHCAFVCRNHAGNLIEVIRAHGFAVRALPAQPGSFYGQSSVYSAWLGASVLSDATETLDALGGLVVDWLIVDHYALDESWERILRPMCRKLMVIDDLANRKHTCDLLLDQNLGRRRHDYDDLVPKTCKVLAGPANSLLRPEFEEMRGYSLQRRVKPQLKHLVVAMGGVDKSDVTSQILFALQGCYLSAGSYITVILGRYAPWYEKVDSIAKQMPWPTKVKIGVNNMAEILANADLAIGAAGSAAWERCCLGLPTLVVVVAENQRSSATFLEKEGCIKVLNNLDLASSNLRFELGALNSGRLRQMSNACAAIADGQGTSRVKQALINYG